MLKDMLELTTVQVARETESTDGMGGVSATTVLTTLTAAAIFESGSFKNLISDRAVRDSTHVLVTDPSYYTWTQADRYVVYDGVTYQLSGRPNDIMFKGDVLILPLELTT